MLIKKALWHVRLVICIAVFTVPVAVFGIDQNKGTSTGKSTVGYEWISGEVIDRELLGFKTLKFGMLQSELAAIGFLCDSQHERVVNCENANQTFLGVDADVGVYLVWESIIARQLYQIGKLPNEREPRVDEIFVTVSEKLVHIKRVLKSELGAPFINSKTGESVWVFANGAVILIGDRELELNTILYFSPERSSLQFKDLFRDFNLNMVLPSLDGKDF